MALTTATATAVTSGGPGDAPGVSVRGHLARLAGLLAMATLLLGWLVGRADVLFADGLRYVAQARAIDRGSAGEGIAKAVDHPAYPLAIVAAHRLAGGDGPDAWQFAAQLASAAAGVLLVVPLYLVARELFGDCAAFPACVLFYAVPLTGHVFADTLSESTFLLFWASGFWCAVRFLKTGALGWLPAVVAFSGLAYLTRPEGLLLPAALLATLGLSPRWVARGLGQKGLIGLAVLLVGSAAVVGPYVALKGGLGTKPSIARLLGTAPRSAAHAVERQRPLEPGQTAARTYAAAGKAVGHAVTDALTWPLVPFSVFGLAAAVWRRRELARAWRLVGVVVVASLLALVRLHATGGYCTPRHALILAIVLLPASAYGVERLLARAVRRRELARLGLAASVGLVLAANAPETLAPVNEGLGGYKQAGRWLAGERGVGGKVVDVTGWSQFYGGREGYTFADLVAAAGDPDARWVVAREAHLRGPWEYCERLRALVDGLEPVEVFPGAAGRRPTKVYLFDRHARTARAGGADAVRR